MSGTEWLSKGVEVLLAEIEKHKDGAAAAPLFDIVIIGSGYGGAVAAARFAGAREMTAKGERQLRVAVLERGKEFTAGDFPSSFAELPGQVRINLDDDPQPKGNRDALFDLRNGQHVSAILGNGLGGGSLINAGVLARPQPWVFKRHWPSSITSAGLEPYFQEVENRLGASPVPAPPQKFDALAAVGRCMSPPRVAERASIAVSFSSRLDPGTGVEHRECIGCGDCFTGCNYNAKNTLAMNYLPLARRRGAEIFTGVTVHSISQSGNAWDIWLMPTDAVTAKRVAEKRLGRAGEAKASKIRPGETLLKEEHYLVPLQARRVILAAGTFGSTEILLRSKSTRGLGVSKRLGQQFSTNGDMISVGYGMRQKVNGSSRDNESAVRRQVGATITGMIDLRDGDDTGLVIEEMAVPAALRRAFEEIVTNTALLQRITKRDHSSHDGKALAWDPLATDPVAIAHTAIYASMGHDGSLGKLVPVTPKPKSEGSATAAQDEPPPCEGGVAVDWTNAGDRPVFAKGIQALQTAHENAEIGGVVIPLPMWRPVPDALSGMLDTGNGSVVTAHPLGGCPMGNQFSDGVVNDLGQVFDGKIGVYDGLVVLDGSIVPASLGVNPCLTIAAVAEHAARELAKQWNLDTFDYANGFCRNGVFDLRNLPPTPAIAVAEPARTPASTSLRLAEKLVASKFRIPRDGSGSQDRYEAWIEIECEPIADLESFLAVHPKLLNFHSATLHVVPIGITGSKGKPIDVRLKGSMSVLERENSTACCRIWRALVAWFLNRGRQDLWQMLVRYLSFKRNRIPAGDQSVFASFIALASQLGEARLFRYSFALLEDAITENGLTLIRAGEQLLGSKRIAYAHKSNLWRQLTELELSWVTKEAKPRQCAGVFSVDLPYFVKEHAFQYQIVEQQNQPAAIADLFSFATWIVRTVGKIHLWSFRAPDYPSDYESESKLESKQKPKSSKWNFSYDSLPDDDSGTFCGCDSRLPGHIPGLHRTRFAVEVQAKRFVAGEMDRDPIKIRAEKILLTRYLENSGAPASVSNPVMLIHGYGASGTTFTLDTVPENLVKHLARNNRQVWVVDLRTSIGLQGSEGQWTFEDVACMDIPTAIDEVLRRSGANKIDIVAHCIGSAMFCMSALGGFLRGFIRDGAHPAGPINLDEHINAVVLMQVGPVIKFPPMNHARGYVAASFKSFLQWKKFNVTEPLRPFVRLLDRLLAVYPYPSYEWSAHHLFWPWSKAKDEAFCNRTSAIFGRLYEHDNLNRKTLKNIRNLLGHVNVKTFEQTIFFAKKGRLADCFGQSPYVNFRTITNLFRFPVCMIHGARNEVFDWQGSQRSIELLESSFERAGPAEAEPFTEERRYATSGKLKPELLPFPRRQSSARYQFLPMLNYGHQDCLIGERAHVDVFPNILHFLQTHANSPSPITQECDCDVVRTPRLGPILGWLRTSDLTARKGCVANISFVPDDQYSPPLFAISIVFEEMQGRARPVPGHATMHKLARLNSSLLPHRTQQSALAILDPSVRGDAIRVVQNINVSLPGKVKDYRVLVLTLHDEPRGFSANGKPEGRGWIVPPKKQNPDDPDESDNRGPAITTDKARLPRDLKAEEILLSDDDASRILGACDDDDVHFKLGRTQLRVVDADYESPCCVAFISAECIRNAGPSSGNTDDHIRNGPIQDDFTFAAGSCRYTSTIFDREFADRGFARLLRRIQDKRQDGRDPRLLLLLGDQIYADSTAGLFDAGGDFQRYDECYAEAWSAPCAREVLRRLPTYMMLDDHELENNAELTRFEHIQRGALSAFEAYQRELAPPNPLLERNGSSQKFSPDHYWYCFSAGGYGFYVMDTRTERTRQPQMDCLSDKMLKDPQVEHLQSWLLNQEDAAPGQPKFVISPSAVFPFSRATNGNSAYAIRSDSWDAFPDSLRQLLAYIAEKHIRNVVFISGDLHCSLAAKMKVYPKNREQDAVHVYSVISSGFYAPYPFANTLAKDLDLTFQGTLADRLGNAQLSHTFGDVVIDYSASAPIVMANGFALLSIQRRLDGRKTLHVEFDTQESVIPVDFDLA